MFSCLEVQKVFSSWELGRLAKSETLFLHYENFWKYNQQKIKLRSVMKKIAFVDIRSTLIFCSSLSSCWSSGPRGWAEALDRGQGSQSSAGIQPDCQQPKTSNFGGRKLFFPGRISSFTPPVLTLAGEA